MTLADYRDFALITTTMITCFGGVPGILLILNKVHEIKKATDGMKDALVTASEKAAHLEGEKVGRVDEQARVEALPKLTVKGMIKP